MLVWLIWLIGIVAGVGGDVLLCWLSWRFIIKPKLTKFIDGRVIAYHRKCLAENTWIWMEDIPIDESIMALRLKVWKMAHEQHEHHRRQLGSSS